MKRTIIALTAILLCCSTGLLYAQDYNILDFGAVGDGKTLNTQKIQTAIDQASEAGGGRVIVPRGEFLTGTLLLKSGVELHLEKKAVLLGSTNVDDYIKLSRWKALIMAEEEENIALTGKGALDGQGIELALNIDSLFYAGKIDSAQYQLKEKRPIAPLRPQLVELVRCKNIRVTGLLMRDCASWVQTYDQCRNLVIDQVTVDSDAYWNNDGLDITDCRNVQVTNCNINSSDDGICLKSYAYQGDYYCDSIYISDCRVRSSASAIKLGTASYDGFRNVVIRNIRVYDTFRSAIAIEQVDGGIMENILVENVKAINTGNALFICIGNRYKAVPPGQFKNVVVRNVRVTVPAEVPDRRYKIRGPALPFFHNTIPSSIVGLPGYPVGDLTLENIEISFPGGGNPAYANLPVSRLDEIPELPHAYPEFSMFGELPAWGLFLRHVDGIKLKNIRLKLRNADYRPAIVLDDVKNAEIEALQVEGDEKENPIYQWRTEEVEVK